MSLAPHSGPRIPEAPPTAIMEFPAGWEQEEGSRAHYLEQASRGTHDLGRSVVRTAAAADLSLQNYQYFRERGDHDLASAAAQQFREKQRETQKVLADTRAKIAGIHPDARASAERYVQPMLGEVFARSRKRDIQSNGFARYDYIIDWLADEHGATNSQLMGFLQDHLDSLQERRQKPELLNGIYEARELYIAGMKKAEMAGYVDPYALKTLQKIEQTTFIIGDEWDRYTTGYIAYAHNRENVFVVNIDHEPGSSRLTETVIHELEHIRNPDFDEYPEWESEALAEHIALSIAHGHWREFDPRLRPNDSSIYDGYRLIQNAILKYGNNEIPTTLATRAHTGGHGGHSQQLYRSAIMQSWGFDVRKWATRGLHDEIEKLKLAGYPEAGYDGAKMVAARNIANRLRWYHAEQTAQKPTNHHRKRQK